MAPEHIWLNEGKREQVKWGLYVLVEELLDQGYLEINTDTEILKHLYTGNFRMVSPGDFKSLLNLLAERLARLSIDPNNPLVGHYSAHSKVALFLLEPPRSTGEPRELKVAPAFYHLTGRPMPDAFGGQQDVHLSLDEIKRLLMTKELVLWQRAFSALELEIKPPYPQEINVRLCRIFISTHNEDFRLMSARLLQDADSCKSIYEVDQESLSRFIEAETNEQLLQEFIRLIKVGTDDDDQLNRTQGTQLLLQLLERVKGKSTI